MTDESTEAEFHNIDDVVEIRRLRQELHRIRNQSLEWAMICEHDCPACDAMYEVIKGAQHPEAGPTK